MRKNLLLTAVAGVAVVMYAGSDSWSPLRAQAGVALTGRVVSEDEGPMEGVVVTARKEGSTISISTVTDDKGRYNFPETKLDSGDYLLKIRAIGYELLGPAGIDVRRGVTAGAGLSLRGGEGGGAAPPQPRWRGRIARPPPTHQRALSRH